MKHGHILATLILTVLITAIPALAQERDSAAQTEVVSDVPMTLEAFTKGGFSGSVPNTAFAKFSPDGRKLLYVKSGSFFLVNLTDGTQTEVLKVSDFDRGQEASAQLLRLLETQRVSAGLINYSWAPSGTHILVEYNGIAFLATLENGNITALTDSRKPIINARLSPNGNMVAYVHDQNLYVTEIGLPKDEGPDLRARRTFQLTSDGGGRIFNGLAEWAASEENDRSEGFWWSPDGRYIAYEQYDDSAVSGNSTHRKVNRVFDDNGDLESISVVTDIQDFPFVGGPNVDVKLGVIDINAYFRPDGDPASAKRWLDLGDDPNIYLSRVGWNASGSMVTFQVLSRDQTRLRLFGANPETGAQIHILTEYDPTWVNAYNNTLEFLSDGRFIWGSERSGFRHLYLYELRENATESAGRALGAITGGAWDVKRFVGVDEHDGMLFFEGFAGGSGQTLAAPLEQHLFVTELKVGADIVPVTEGGFWHDTAVHVGTGNYVDVFSSATHPTSAAVRNIEGKVLLTLADNTITPEHPAYQYSEGFPSVHFVGVEAADGSTIYMKLFLPVDYDEEREYPLIMLPYGGPAVGRQATNKWMGSLYQGFVTLLTQKGYIVARGDNRGTPDRGRDFERQCAFSKELGCRAMGPTVEADQIAFIDYLKASPDVNDVTVNIRGNDVGVMGWSYGGTTTTFLMTSETLKERGESVKAGVAIAPFIEARLYDTWYTERFLGDPIENAEGYNMSSCGLVGQNGNRCDNLEGHLLVMHGNSDDNVFPEHTLEVQEAVFDAASRDASKLDLYDQMIFSGQTHGFASRRFELFHYAIRHFDRYLPAEVQQQSSTPRVTQTAQACEHKEKDGVTIVVYGTCER